MQNNAIRVLVVDDEPDSHAIIALMLSRQDLLRIDACLYAFDLSQAESLIDLWHPDWIMVDLDLSASHGFSIAERLSDEEDAELTFITAHERETASILAYSELHLLQKPINKHVLMQELQFMLMHQAYREKQTRLNTFKHNLSHPYTSARLAVPVQQQWLCLPLQDIYFLCRKDGLAQFCLSETQFLAEHSFDHYQRLLMRQTGFLQIHPQYIVQLAHVVDIDLAHQKLIMRNGEMLPVVAHKLPVLRQMLSKP